MPAASGPRGRRGAPVLLLILALVLLAASALAAPRPLVPRLDWHATRGLLNVSGHSAGGRSVLEVEAPPGTAAAFFVNHGRLAAVLATEAELGRLDADVLAFATGLRLLDTRRAEGVTVLWFELPRPVSLEVGTRGAGAWRVILHEEGRGPAPLGAAEVATALAGLQRAPLDIHDEAAGEWLAVVPSTMAGASPGGFMGNGRDHLATGTGIVWRRDEAGLARPNEPPVSVASPSIPDPVPDRPAEPPAPPALVLSDPVAPFSAVPADVTAPGPPVSPLGLAGWRLPPGETVLQRRRRLEAELVARLPAARLPLLVELARLHLAHDQPAEALTRLASLEELPAGLNPDLMEQARALRVAARLLRDGDPGPADGARGELGWWGVVLGEGAAPSPDLLPADYPPPLQLRLGLALAGRLAAEGRLAELMDLTGRLLDLAPGREQRARLIRLRARAQEGLGAWRDAVAALEQLAAGGSREALPAAVERARLGLERGDLLPGPTLGLLADAMTLWRGHPEAPDMLRVMARLAESHGRPLLAFEAWRQRLAASGGPADGEATSAFERLLAALLVEEQPDPARLMAALEIVGALPPASLARPEVAGPAVHLAGALGEAGLPATAARLLASIAGSAEAPATAASMLIRAAHLALEADDPALARELAGRLEPGQPVPAELQARIALASGASEQAAAVLVEAGTASGDPLFVQAALAAGRAGLLADAVPESPVQRVALATALAGTGDEAGLQRLVIAERTLDEPAAAALAPRLAGSPGEVVAMLEQQTRALRRLLGAAAGAAQP